MALDNHSDQELLALLEQGSETAFAELYERFRPQVRRFALRVAKSHEAADEIVQNVLLKLWSHRSEANQIQNLSGWLTRVTTNEALDFLKKAAREKALAEKVWMSLQNEPAYAENDYVLKDYLQLIEQAVRSLPAQQQRVYRLSRPAGPLPPGPPHAHDRPRQTQRTLLYPAAKLRRRHASRTRSTSLPAPVRRI
jgi:RNA polymerase sigma factor (sigma-70 family)